MFGYRLVRILFFFSLGWGHGIEWSEVFCLCLAWNLSVFVIVKRIDYNCYFESVFSCVFLRGHWNLSNLLNEV